MEKQNRARYAGTARAVSKPAGGFVFITGTSILSAWWAYRRGIVSLLDLRVWLAAFELMARRCSVQKGRLPRFSMSELCTLVGSKSDCSISRSISALVRAGLLTWSETRVTAGPGLRDTADNDGIRLEALLEQVPNHSRRVPVPRRIVRMLAKDGTRAIIATTFAHLLRCLYYGKGCCRPKGTCKASWVADAFGVDIRNVKAARKALVERGILSIERCSQWFLNRYGSLVTVNLTWDGGTLPCRRSPSPSPETCRGLPPPNREHELLRMKNQKPPSTGAGLLRRNRKNAPPTLRHVVPADLINAGRMNLLHQQACEAGYVNGSEADRLKFFAAAEHARAIGDCNVPGLFASMVRQRRWKFITLAEEDAARRRINALEQGMKPERGATVPRRLVHVGEIMSGLMSSLAGVRLAHDGCSRKPDHG